MPGATPSRAPPAQFFAALDLGTNNCRLLIGAPTRAGFRVVESFSRVVRLGEGLARSGALSDAAMDRTLAALSACADKLERRPVRRLAAVATEACRRATNGQAFLARAAIESGEHDLIVLDEFTYALKYGWVPWPEVEAVLRARDPLLHVVVTGRDALPELIALADTVSEIQPVKHDYEAGIGAQTGIEY
jgi:hypothetical protein